MSQTVLHFLTTFAKPLIPIIYALEQANATPYLVGGAVRDLVLHRTIKDIDIEVHNLHPEKLELILKKFGTVKLVGKQFGVFRLAHKNGAFEHTDWSLPRTDSVGRKPIVSININMTIEQACRRRDLTINAMAINMITIKDNFEKILHLAEQNQLTNSAQVFSIIDPFDGLTAIKEQRLSAVDTTLFIEDPLRFYRVMQFIGRFEFTPDQELNELCIKMNLKDFIHLPISKERIYQEIRKLILQSKRPSLGWRWLEKIGCLKKLYYEVGILTTIQQRTDYHPEGSVFEHSMQALDAAARFTDYLDENEKFLLCLGALCHDLGKTESTDADLRCHGHELSGVPLVKNFISRFLDSPETILTLQKLVRHHLMPRLLLDQKSSIAAWKRLALKLAPHATIRQLAIICLVDQQGRNGQSQIPLKTWEQEFEQVLALATNLNILHAPEPAILQGKDLLKVIEPGPELGALLKQAYEIQIEENIHDIEILKQRILVDKKGL